MARAQTPHVNNSHGAIERASRNVNTFATCKHACRISAAVIVVVEHFVQLAPKEDSDTVAHRLLATAKGGTHTHVIISDNTFPVKRRLRVNKTPNNSNTCELPIYFCTTCKQSAKIGLCLEVPLWKAHVKAKRSLPRLTASNSAFKNAHSTLHSVLQLSQGQLFLNRADQQYSMCC